MSVQKHRQGYTAREPVFAVSGGLSNEPAVNTQEAQSIAYTANAVVQPRSPIVEAAQAGAGQIGLAGVAPALVAGHLCTRSARVSAAARGLWTCAAQQQAVHNAAWGTVQALASWLPCPTA